LFYSLIKIDAPTTSFTVIFAPSASSIMFPEISEPKLTFVSVVPLSVKFTVAITPSPSFDGKSLEREEV